MVPALWIVLLPKQVDVSMNVSLKDAKLRID